MDRRAFMRAARAAAGWALLPRDAFPFCISVDGSTEHRGWLIYIDPRLGQTGEQWLHDIATASASFLTAALAAGNAALQLRTGLQIANNGQLAYNHLLLVGFADDSLVKAAWQREATISGATIYVFGFGNIRGSVGYIESDRNPFLHAANIPIAPYETELITITGTDTTGIGLAVDAFLKQGLVNGLVAQPGWIRPSATLLDRDPLLPSFTLPTVLPTSLGSFSRIAVTQASEDEYRGVLADTGIEPVSIWRAKYYRLGEWQSRGLIAAFHNYAAGLHRRAYGNTAWYASFASPVAAATAAPLIAKAAGLTRGTSGWKGDLPPYAWGDAQQGDAPTTGTLELSVSGESILMAARLSVDSQ